MRADERLKTLRKVRAAVTRLDRDPASDPYLWGYGGSVICRAVGDMVRAEREAQGL